MSTEGETEALEKRSIKRVYCVVPNCKNRRGYPATTEQGNESSNQNVDFFAFPQTWDRLGEKWTAAIGRPNFKFNDTHRVCSEHFAEEDFYPILSSGSSSRRVHNKKKLKRGALPSLKIPKASLEDRDSDAFQTETGTGREKMSAPSDSRRLQSPMRMRMVEPCLLCSRVSIESAPSKIYQFHGAKGLSLLNDQLWNAFILREVLNVAPWKFEKLLQTLGTSIQPSGWFIICNTCSEQIYEAAEVHDKISQLQQRISDLKASVNSTFRESLIVKDDEDNGSDVVSSSRVMIRRLLSADTQSSGFDVQNSTGYHGMDWNFDDAHFSCETDDEESGEHVLEMKNQLSESDDESEAVGEHAVKHDPLDDDWLPTTRRVGSGTAIISAHVPNNDFFDGNASRFNKSRQSKHKFLENLRRRSRKRAMKTLNETQSEDSKRDTYEYQSSKGLQSLNSKRKPPFMNKKAGLRTRKGQQSIFKKTAKLKLTEDKNHLRTLDAKFFCSKCPAKYVNRSHFEKHLKKHELSLKLFEGKFDCSICNFPLLKATGKGLESHLRMMHESSLKPGWDPSKPQNEYIHKIPIRRRVRTSNSNSSAKFACSKCPAKVVVEAMLEHHLDVHERVGRDLHCPECNFPFLRVDRLSKHLQSKHPDSRRVTLKLKTKSSFFCNACDFTTKNSNEFKKHMHNHKISTKATAPDLACSRCSGKFKGEVAFQRHQDLHEKVGKDLHCPECKYPFSTKGKLNRHLQIKHPDSELLEVKTVIEGFLCNICGFKAKNSGTYKTHIYNHKIYDGSVDPSISATDFICNVCKQTFSTRLKLQKHKVNNHADELGIETWKCTECPKFFSRKDAWTYHTLKIHGSKSALPFTCDQCGYATAARKTLNQHMETHGPKKVCEFCSASYCSFQNLRSHMKARHPEKVELTKKNYFSNVNVERLEKEDVNDPFRGEHISTFQQQEYPCKFCYRSFPQKSAMVEHMKTSHSEKLYQCGLCENKYMSVASLQLHKKINHNTGAGVKCGWCFKRFSHRVVLYDHRHSCRARPTGPGVPKILAVPDTNDDESYNGEDETTTESVKTQK